jgi:hypothetical protein
LASVLTSSRRSLAVYYSFLTLRIILRLVILTVFVSGLALCLSGSSALTPLTIHYSQPHTISKPSDLTGKRKTNLRLSVCRSDAA